MDRLKSHWQKERGQSIVIFALSLVGMLLFVGLAVDVGVIFQGRGNLSRAVDSAVLAGAVEVPRSGKVGADIRANQYLAVNDITFDTGLAGFESATGYSALGARRYAITVTRQIDLYFLPLINFDHFTTRETATAEYNPQLEIYAEQPGPFTGMYNAANLINFGPDAKREHGDAYTPLNGDSPNQYWPELQGVYRYRIHVPSGYPESLVRVELLDPDCFNQSNAVVNPVHIDHSKTTDSRNETITDDRADSVILDQRTWDSFNPYWLVRMDKNRCSYGEACYSPGGGSGDSRYDASYNTTTSYHLFYYALLSDGSVISKTMATYIKGGAASDDQTDMRWVCPGGTIFSSTDPAVTWGPGTFEVNMDDLKNDPDYPIYADPDDGHLSLYLDVEGISGSSENGWALRAGPMYSNTIPVDVNDRNIWTVEWVDDNPGVPSALDPKGVVIWAMGHMPWSTNVATGAFTHTISYIGPEMAGKELSIAHFDNDDAGEQISYTFDTIPWQDWFRFGALSGPDEWVTDTFKVPEPPTHTFYGGYLQAHYKATYLDSSVWRLQAVGAATLVE